MKAVKYIALNGDTIITGVSDQIEMTTAVAAKMKEEGEEPEIISLEENEKFYYYFCNVKQRIYYAHREQVPPKNKFGFIQTDWESSGFKNVIESVQKGNDRFITFL